jgi:superfamily II DNA or RNA helicase
MIRRHRKSLEDEIARAEARLSELEHERGQLSRKLTDLRQQLRSETEVQDRADWQAPASTPQYPAPTTPDEKIALFMDRFRGRHDVYPKLWINASKGRKGYSPACGNEWARGLCAKVNPKPKVKCGDCQHQAFLPVTKQVVRDHLQGRHVIGVYPMLADDTCWFIAIDFDKAGWQNDVAAVAETCRNRAVPHAIERSRSGNGAHLWVFFNAPVPATTARKLGCYLLTETMARRHELPMASYDRLFPNQDTLPKGGFGNLIALPFQHEPRQQGHSVFIDEQGAPYQDQWGFLASIPRLCPDEVDALVQEATERGQIIGVRRGGLGNDDEEAMAPWRRPPSHRAPRLDITEKLPPHIRAVSSQLLFVETAGLPSVLINQIKRLAAFQNPDFYKKQAMRLSTALTPRIISCAEEHPEHLGLPRGCLDALQALLSEHPVELVIDDQRTDGTALKVAFQGELTALQAQAAEAMAAHDIGVLIAPPGSGKTVMSVNLLARRRRSTLILVHRTQLLEQWVAQLAVFLGLAPSEIGQVGGGKRKPNGQLDVAMIQSLVRKDSVDDLVASYGQVIVDECHHVPAVSFERVMREVKARFVIGLTATPQRRDGHHPILTLQLGPVRFAIDAKHQAAARPFAHRLILRETDFRLADADGDIGIQELYRQLAADDARNQMILHDVTQALSEGRSPILLTERRDHLARLAEQLTGVAKHLIVLQGGMKTKERQAAVDRLASIPACEPRLVIAIGKFIGEGFDDTRLDTLFLAMPFSWKGTLVQYVGRLHRRHEAKTEVRVIDYVDREVPMLARMLDKRMQGYRGMGYQL